jgi:hypothetical protein
MDFEAAVASYITTDQHLFISPQYVLDLNEKRIEPDLLALDVKKKRIYIVEVSSASGYKKISDKIVNVYRKYFKEIKEYLLHNNIITQEWKLGIWAFVRKENIPKLRESVGDSKEICITPIEDTFSWDYFDDRWDGKAPGLSE